MKTTSWVLVFLVGATACSKKPPYEELEAKAVLAEASAKARAQRLQEQREEKDRAQKEEEALQGKQEEAKRTAALQAKEGAIAERRQQYVALTPAQREKALRDTCARPETCEKELREAIATAGADEAERTKLRTLADRFGQTTDVPARDAYVGEVARSFIAQGKKGFSVDATGPNKMRFVIKAPFCSQEFLKGFVDSALGSPLRPKGFAVVECIGGADSWHIDL